MKKYSVGQKVRVKKFKIRPKHWNPKGEMDIEMGKEMTISPCPFPDKYFVKENLWCWKENDFYIDLLEDDLFEI